MTIREMAKRAFYTNETHGFNDKPVNVDRKLLLIAGEVVEAQNELRDGHSAQEIYSNDPISGEWCGTFEPPRKPEGFPIELADAVIRIGGLAEQLGIDLERAIELKMAYNETRPFKHGKQF